MRRVFRFTSRSGRRRSPNCRSCCASFPLDAGYCMPGMVPSLCGAAGCCFAENLRLCEAQASTSHRPSADGVTASAGKALVTSRQGRSTRSKGRRGSVAAQIRDPAYPGEMLTRIQHPLRCPRPGGSGKTRFSPNTFDAHPSRRLAERDGNVTSRACLQHPFPVQLTLPARRRRTHLRS